MKSYETLSIRCEDGVDWVTLNRPESLNALNRRMVEELTDYFSARQTDHATRIIVLRGAGRAFCAGLDLKEARGGESALETRTVQEGLVRQRQIANIVILMRRCPQAIIALVHGPACGGGFAFALAADIRIAGESARMNAAFIRIGLSGCDIGVSYMLPRLVGHSLAAELLMTGRFIHADRALRLGLVSEVVADDRMDDAARSYIDDMLTTAPLGLRLTKECLNMNVDAGSLEAAIAMEDRNQILCTKTEDAVEGGRAFLQKRKPVYTGR